MSGAHFNPVITLADRVLGGMTTPIACAYVAAQVVGACIGVALGNLMYALPPFTLSTHECSAHGLWLGEVVATFGLVLGRDWHPSLHPSEVVVPHDAPPPVRRQTR